MSLSFAVLASTRSGRGHSARCLRQVVKELSRRGNVLLAQQVSWAKEVSQVVEHACALDIDVVVAIGGDGFVAACAPTVAAWQKILLPIPAGSGNDFVRSVGLPLDVGEVFAGFEGYCSRQVDMLRVTGQSGQVKYCLGAVSTGIDAAIIAAANASRIPGALGYRSALLQAALRYKPFPYLIEFRDETGQRRRYRHHAYLATCANTSVIGGGIKIASGSLGDGMFELVTFRKPPSVRKILQAVSMANAGKIQENEFYEVTRLAWAKITPLVPIVAYADGDALWQGSVEVATASQRLKVLAPVE